MQIPVVKLGPVDMQSKYTLLSLREGQIVKGVVQSKEGTDLVLNLGDHKVVAQTELEVGVGQPVWLEAITVKPEQVIFKLLVGDGHESLELAKVPEDIFSKLNMTPSSTAGKAIEVLMSYNLPITKELIEELTGNLKGHMSLKDVEILLHTLILLKNKQLPLTKGAQQLLLKFFSGESEPEEVAQAIKLFNQFSMEQIEYPNMYFLWWQNELQQGEIYLWPEAENNQDKKNSYQAVVIHFYTQNLGELWVKLNKLDDKLNLDLTAETQEGVNLFNEHLFTLEALLATAGYNIGNISYTRRKVESVFALEEKTITYRGIDTKV
jgi:hypothetical protein